VKADETGECLGERNGRCVGALEGTGRLAVVAERRVKGCLTDGGYALAQEWRNEKPQVPFTVCAKRLAVSDTTISRALAAKKRPSDRAKKDAPRVTGKKQYACKRRRLAAKRIALETKFVTGYKTVGAHYRKGGVLVKEHKVYRHELHKKYPSAAAVTGQYNKKHKTKWSVSTIRNDLRKEGIVSMVRPHRPPLSTDQKKRRLLFAKKTMKAIDWSDKNLRLHFQDEARLDGQDYGHHTELCERGSVPTPRNMDKVPAGANLMGVMGAQGSIGHRTKKKSGFKAKPGTRPVKRLFFGGGLRMKAVEWLEEFAKANVDVLRSTGRHRIIYVQDGWGVHSAKVVQQWFKANGVYLLPNWPPNSPDLNPIENLWAILKRRVAERRPLGLENLMNVIQEEWDNLPDEMIYNLTASFKERLEECIRRNGGHTGY
jgi:hypothetical protein